MLITEKQKEEIVEELFRNQTKQLLLKELDLKGIKGQFDHQKSINFKHHADTVQDLIDKGIYPKFIDFANGIAKFAIKSSEWQTGKGFKNKTYEMAIRFYDWPQFWDDPQFTLSQRVSKMMNGNLGVACSCPSFKYHYGYPANIKGSELFTDEFRQFQQTQPAPVRNPFNIGIGCKHMDLLLNPYALKFGWAPTILKNVAAKLPKPTDTSPSARQSTKATSRTGIKHG